jgi:hypothetical protein
MDMDEIIRYCKENNVEELKQKKFSLLNVDSNNEFPLHAAVSSNSLDVINYFVTLPEIDEAINKRSRDRFKQCPLHIAARKCEYNPSVIDILIEHGANVDERDGDFKYTPLHHAVYCNNVECLKHLLKNKANIFVGNYHSFTPLQRAHVGTECHSILSELTRKELKIGEDGVKRITPKDGVKRITPYHEVKIRTRSKTDN